MISIDLNCDMGEGIGNDAAIMPFISSANIACGYHAGDSTIIKKTIALCLQHTVAVGAHPGFNDRENFGRREITLQHDEVYKLVLQQVIIVKDIAAALGAKLHHVKPHGALYNMAAKNSAMAAAIAKAVKDVDQSLVLYGLNNSFLISEAQKAGLITANEVFADRRYNNDGSLVSRTKSGALIEDDKEAITQVLDMVLHRKVVSAGGVNIPVQPETICIHGDGKNAVSFAKKIRGALYDNRVVIRSL
jgi:UPF0271 protein